MTAFGSGRPLRRSTRPRITEALAGSMTFAPTPVYRIRAFIQKRYALMEARGRRRIRGRRDLRRIGRRQVQRRAQRVERIGAGLDLLAVGEAVAVGVAIGRIGAVDVLLV